MRILVRYLSHKTKGSDTWHDVKIQASRIRIGRGTDQEIHLSNLRIALAHAELVEGSDGRLRLQTLVASGFSHNGALVQAAVLTPGDELYLGGYHFRVVDAAGCNLALEIAEDTAARGRETEVALRKRAKMDLTAAGLRKRPWALGLAGLIAVLFLLMPLVSATIPAAAGWLRMLPLVPSDHAWSSGEVSPAHAHFGTDCNACHTIPFMPTRNSACVACHQDTRHHAEAEVLAGGMFDDVRCGTCHHEHAGKDSIVRQDESLCVDCHGDLKSVLAATKIQDVRSFGDKHPEFRPGMSHAIGDQTLNRRVALDDGKALRENPGVEFSHAGHLKPEGMESPTRGTVKLACADCHQVEPGGGLMRPIAFETACHDCHRLNIPGDDVREVPHGDIGGAIGAIGDYYQAWALRGGYPNAFAPDVVQPRRRPGQPLTATERQEALDWAKKTTALATAEMLAYTTCGVCHTVEPTGKGEGADAWRMRPVNIPYAWLPQAHFSHDQHRTQPCKDCHAGAAKSDSSADINLPGIDNCRTCHGGGDAGAGKLASTCITCHDFHRAKTAMFGQ
jgi:hypothetical protein